MLKVCVVGVFIVVLGVLCLAHFAPVKIVATAAITSLYQVYPFSGLEILD